MGFSHSPPKMPTATYDADNDGTVDDAEAVGGTAAADMSTDAEATSKVNAHAGADGSSHTFIDQDVTSGAAPVLAATNFTGLTSGDTVHFDVDLSGTFNFINEGNGSTDTTSGLTVTSGDLASFAQLEIALGKLEIDAACSGSDIDAVLALLLTGLPDLVDRTIVGLEVDLTLTTCTGVNADRLISFGVVNQDNLGDMSTAVSVAPTATEYEMFQVYKNTGPRMGNWSARANVHELAQTIILTAGGDSWRLRLGATGDRIATSATEEDNTHDEVANTHASKSHAVPTVGGVPYLVISINPRTGGTEGDIHVSISKIRVSIA
jgi:hypothetical protein